MKPRMDRCEYWCAKSLRLVAEATLLDFHSPLEWAEWSNAIALAVQRGDAGMLLMLSQKDGSNCYVNREIAKAMCESLEK